MAQLSYLNSQHVDDIAGKFVAADVHTAKQILDTPDEQLANMMQPMLTDLLRIIEPALRVNVIAQIKHEALIVHLSQFEQLRLTYQGDHDPEAAASSTAGDQTDRTMETKTKEEPETSDEQERQPTS